MIQVLFHVMGGVALFLLFHLTMFIVLSILLGKNDKKDRI